MVEHRAQHQRQLDAALVHVRIHGINGVHVVQLVNKQEILRSSRRQKVVVNHVQHKSKDHVKLIVFLPLDHGVHAIQALANKHGNQLLRNNHSMVLMVKAHHAQAQRSEIVLLIVLENILIGLSAPHHLVLIHHLHIQKHMCQHSIL